MTTIVVTFAELLLEPLNAKNITHIYHTLVITVLYYTMLYYTILSCGTKGHITPVGSQWYNVKLSNFITQCLKALSNQQIR